MRSNSPWKLVGFEEQLDAWIDRETPPDDLVLIVLPWILTRCENPYQGVRRAEGFANLWYGQVPRSDDGWGKVVACSYWIEESTHTVRCDQFATLSLPL